MGTRTFSRKSTCPRAALLRVGGAFVFAGVGLDGGVHLASTHVGTLVDDLESWSGAKGGLVLDGFTYVRLAGSARDAEARINWLEHQAPAHLGPEFRPQPWEQLIAVLRAMGHPNEGRSVAIARNNRLRRAGKVVRGLRTLHWLYGVLVGYGYRPDRLIVAVLAVWLTCAAAYNLAAHPPGGARPFIEPDPQKAAGSYDSFSPLIYSADVLLPVVDLGYSDAWTPVLTQSDGHPDVRGRCLRTLRWFEIVLGWLFGGALATMLGNLIKKE